MVAFGATGRFVGDRELGVYYAETARAIGRYAHAIQVKHQDGLRYGDQIVI